MSKRLFLKFPVLFCGIFLLLVVYTENAQGQYRYTRNKTGDCSFTALPTVTPTNINCKGDSSGALKLKSYDSTDASSGKLPFSWEWHQGTATGPVVKAGTASGFDPVKVDSSLTQIPAGVYVLVTTDANGCKSNNDFTINEPSSVLSVTSSSVSPLCSGGANGSATVSASGGTPSYTYNWSSPPGGSTSSISSLAAGAYTVTVSDAKGCDTVLTFNLTQPSTITATITKKNATCSLSNGSATVNASGGTPGYTYAWKSPPGGTGTSITNLGTGTYTVTVTDAASCTKTQTVSITTVAPPTVSISAQTNLTCYQVCNTGTATALPAGGTPTYTYAWNSSPVQSSQSASSLCAGTYTVTVTDANSCTATTTVSITEPLQISSNLSQTDVTCSSKCDGSATVAPSGGSSPYTTTWSLPIVSATNTASLLCAATYTVTVTDFAGCADTTSFTITQPQDIQINVSVVNNSCSGGNTGSATATPSGGTSPYTYAWSSPPGGTTSAVSSLSTGTYTVTVTDKNGCTKTATPAITEPTTMSVSVSHVDASCSVANGSATATPSGGSSPYTYTWSSPPGGSSSVVSGLSAGTYTVTVRDAGLCSKTATVAVSNLNAPTVSVSVVNASCFNVCDASATATGAAGTPGYTYAWSTGGTGTSVSALCDGTFTVTITDANSCTATATATITEPAVVSATISKTNVLCFGQNSGSATVTPGGGTPSYSYSWSTAPAQSGATASSLTIGTYTVTVSDSKGCSATQTTSITEPTLLTNSTATFPTSCFGGCNGRVVANPAGGTSPYTYNWSTSPAQSGITATGLCAGGYTVTVTDNNGCTKTSARAVTEPEDITIPFSTVNSTCGNSTGSATAAPAGGTSPYTYAWASPPGGTGSSVSNLSAGVYTVTVTDSKGCTKTDDAIISNSNAPTVQTSVTNVSCNGGGDGTATASALGGTPGYTYSWNTSPASTATAVTGLSAGSYIITVTDASNCTAFQSADITEPPAFTITPTLADVVCFGAATGSATVNVAGGSSPYSYAWTTSPGQTTSTASGLTAGTYTVTVTDTKSCTGTSSVTLTQPAALNISLVTQSDVSCNAGSDGSVTVSASNGTSPYSYQWSSLPALTTATATGLTASTYTVTVSDANLCSSTLGITITEPAVLTVSITSADAVCGSNNGSATATVSGGNSPFTYSWTTSPAKTSSAVTGLSGGVYFVTVSDTKGCTAMKAAGINNVNGPTISLVGTTDASCPGSCNGTATISASGGSSPYVYDWASSSDTTASAGGLCAGDQLVSVTDSTGCVSTYTVTISEPTALSLDVSSSNVTCNLGSNGTATVTVSGGSPLYSYSWSDGKITAAISGLTAGTYTVTVTDAGSCTATATAVITQPAAINVSYQNANDASCYNACDGDAAVTVSGGITPYTYNWDTSPAQSLASATALCAGNYTVTVTDKRSCTATYSATITQPSQIQVSTSKKDATCGLSDGSATATVSGGSPGYTYAWNTSPVKTSATVASLSAGVYTVTVTDASTCTQSAVAGISNSGAAVLSLSSTPAGCFGQSNGTATVSVVSGTPTYSYSWNTSPAQTTTAISGLSAGAYYASVLDGNNCITIDSAIVTEPADIVINMTTASPSCNGSSNGSATAAVSGGTPGYAYAWSGLSQTSATATGLTTGVYTVTVTDAASCTKTETASLTQPNALSASITSSSDMSCYQNADGTANASASGGTSPYTFSWNTSPVQSSQNASGLSAGTYTVTVTDAATCTSTATAIVTEPSAITVTMTTVDAVCGTSSGSATAAVSGGSPGYDYLWNTSPAATTSAASGLTAGVYFVIITDTKGCTAIKAAGVNNVNGPTVTLTGYTDATCNGSCDGTATISASGGASPYSYSWVTTPVQTLASATGLCAGSQYMTVTDFSGCVSTFTVTISEPTAISLSTTSTPVSCASGADGTATVSASNGTPLYSYNWSSGSTSNATSGLTSGTYTITVTDAASCTATATVSVTQPAVIDISLTASVDATCFSNCNGSATVSVTGGSTPYVYSWNTSPAQSLVSATALCAGTYTVTVTDKNNCSASLGISISEPVQILASASAQDATCGLSDGSATAAASGGSPGYTYAWSTSPFQSTATATAISAGLYTVTISDASSCTATAIAAVSNIGAATLSVTTTDASCSGQCDGTATVSVVAGTPSFSYSWNTTPAQTSTAAAALCAGTHYISVLDGNNCITIDSATVAAPPAITISMSATPPSCNGGSDGSASATVSGGMPGYAYTWTSLAQISPTATGLTTGTYTVTVTDITSCSQTATINITQPGALSVSITGTTHASCFQLADGTANATASGGTSPYSYSWDTSPAQSSQNASGLNAGTYTVTVSDAGTCSATAAVTITEPTDLSLSMSTTDANCTQADGAATVSVSGGTASYTYSWNTSPAQTTTTASNIPSGIYDVLVRDAKGCTKTGTTGVNDIGGPVPATLGQDATCYQKCDGSAFASASGGSLPYVYSWNTTPVQTGQNATGLCAGTHFVLVTDKNSCKGTDSVTIGQPDSLVISFVTDSVVCFGANNGSATANASGGTGSYTYTWSPSGNTGQTQTGLPAGFYYITVQDNNLCTKSDSVEVKEPSQITANPAYTPTTCLSSCDGSATLSPLGGTGPYSYAWSGMPAQTSATATGLCATFYTVTITDSKNCVAIDTFKVPSLDLLGVLASDTLLCMGDSAVITVSGATTYWWAVSTQPNDTIATGSTLTVFPVNTTTYIVTGLNGVCASTDSVSIRVNVIPVSIFANPSFICVGDSTLLVASGADTYLWSTTATNDSIWVAPIVTTTYSLTATDTVEGCDSVVNITIVVNDITLTVNPDSICAGDVALLTASGANAYWWAEETTPNDTISTNDSVLVNPLSTTCYIVTATNTLTGCSLKDTICAKVNTPFADAGTDRSACKGDTVNLQGTIADATGSYWISTGSGTFSPDSSALSIVYTPAPADSVVDFFLVTTGPCTNDMDTVRISFDASPSVYAGPDQTILIGNSAQLNGTMNNTSGITWTTSGSGSFTPNNHTLNAVYVPSTNDYKSTSIFLKITANDGCYTATDSMELKIVKLTAPNVMTPYPSSPGVNDVFMIDGLPENAYLVIFDRWGLKIFETNNYRNDWDAEGVAPGVYYYILKYKDIINTSGFIEVIKEP